MSIRLESQAGMIDKKALAKAEKQLKRHNQSHLLAFWEELSTPEKECLLGQIDALDFSKIDDWVSNLVKNDGFSSIPSDFTPVEFYGARPEGPEQAAKYLKARELGLELIRQGKVAAFVVAGGQGTRLGFDGPKGDFPISPVKNKTLFEIFAETIAAVSKRYRADCPWYIMTSPLNYSRTVGIFRDNDFYGLKESDVFIFEQGTLPNFSFDGRILLEDKARLSCSPDGHGGSLKALFKSGALEDMKRRGVEFISYFQVDNPMIKIFDPLFIGLHAMDKAQMSSKVLIKSEPKEEVGNFCLVDGRVTVIEYSDLPDELAQKRNADGSLVFQLGSIAIHIINRSFVEELHAEGFSLPLHRAVKKVSYIDDDGKRAEPTEPNGVKLESFVFDALPMASKSIILQTLRSEEFSPVKNATGAKSAETAREALVARAAAWLESAGVSIPRKADGSIDAVIEIAPSFALEQEHLKDKVDQIPRIKRSGRIYLE